MKRILALALAFVTSNPSLAAQSKSAPTERVPKAAKTNIGEEFSRLALRALFVITANQNSAPTDMEGKALGALGATKLSLYGPDGTKRKNVNATRGEQVDAENGVWDTIVGLREQAMRGPLKNNCVAEFRAQLQARMIQPPVSPLTWSQFWTRRGGWGGWGKERSF